MSEGDINIHIPSITSITYKRNKDGTYEPFLYNMNHKDFELSEWANTKEAK